MLLLVKHIIAQCTLAQTLDQVSITVLDAIGGIDLSWKNITENTIENVEYLWARFEYFKVRFVLQPIPFMVILIPDRTQRVLSISLITFFSHCPVLL